VLLDNQLEAIKKLKEAGITAKVNSIIIPGINDHHTVAVAEKVSELGADILNCLPYYQNEGTVFENIPEPEPQVVKSIQDKAQEYLPQMKHCARCRADAIGLIGEQNPEEITLKLLEASTKPIIPAEERPYVAVSTMEGVLVNQHLGEADTFKIYKMDELTGTSEFVESRRAPAPGGGDRRWQLLADTLSDCRAVMVNGAGNKPTDILKKHGIEVMVMEGVIDEAVTGYFTGKDLKHLIKSSQIHACKTSCSGTGTGCS
jgi:nitrogen fixation protein NifB